MQKKKKLKKYIKENKKCLPTIDKMLINITSTVCINE